MVFKIWDIPKYGNPLIFEETDFTVRFADLMFPIRCSTVVELRLPQMEKKRILQWGLKIFAPNYQNAHPYAKPGRTNCLAYVAVSLF